jgi:chemotaxis protein methyltransferase CheR
LPDLPSYRKYLESHKEEEKIFDALCNITISRFYRDKGVFDRLKTEFLPALAEMAVQNRLQHVRCWSVGSCSGEEPYTLQILWKFSVLPQVKADIPLRILATDRDISLMGRAKKGTYHEGSFKDMPREYIVQAFEKRGDMYHIKDFFKQDVQFLEQDIRQDLPESEFDLILCRNLVFTYFEDDLQREVFYRVMTRLKPGGFFMVGIHESIPEEQQILHALGKCIYKKST